MRSQSVWLMPRGFRVVGLNGNADAKQQKGDRHLFGSSGAEKVPVPFLLLCLAHLLRRLSLRWQLRLWLLIADFREAK